MVGSDRMEGASCFVEVDEMKVLNSRKSLLGDKTRHWKEEERKEG